VSLPSWSPLFIGTVGVSAASIGIQPTVVIAKDFTRSGSCTLTLDMDISTSQHKAIRIFCPTGTIIGSARVSRSEAVAEHEAYVQLPSENAPLSVWQQTIQAIHQLMQSKAAMLRPASSPLPLTACGSTNKFSANWSANGDNFYSSISFYKTANCQNVVLETAVVQGLTSATAMYWDHVQYASFNQGVGCPYIGTNTLSQTFSSTQPAGYYFEPWVANNQCNYLTDTEWYHDIGPIN
jgi:hypothetical protein